MRGKETISRQPSAKTAFSLPAMKVLLAFAFLFFGCIPLALTELVESQMYTIQGDYNGLFSPNPFHQDGVPSYFTLTTPVNEQSLLSIYKKDENWIIIDSALTHLADINDTSSDGDYTLSVLKPTTKEKVAVMRPVNTLDQLFCLPKDGDAEGSSLSCVGDGNVVSVMDCYQFTQQKPADGREYFTNIFSEEKCYDAARAAGYKAARFLVDFYPDCYGFNEVTALTLCDSKCALCTSANIADLRVATATT